MSNEDRDERETGLDDTSATDRAGPHTVDDGDDATAVTVTVTYYCPHCGALAELDRDAYLADKAVTPFPFEGWTYATPDEEYESAEGVRFVCGEDGTLKAGEDGCGEPFYLSFVKYENGREVDPRRPTEYVELSEGTGPRGPRGPSGPTGQGGR
jgi:hypothetical protein